MKTLTISIITIISIVAFLGMLFYGLDKEAERQEILLDQKFQQCENGTYPYYEECKYLFGK